jgi:hypothetical protein
VVPRSRGGADVWENVVAACRRCNHYKGDRHLRELGLELRALPYVPNFAEYLAPSLQFGLAIWVFQEPFDPAQWWTFGLIWLGLALFTANMVLRRRA